MGALVIRLLIRLCQRIKQVYSLCSPVILDFAGGSVEKSRWTIAFVEPRSRT